MSLVLEQLRKRAVVGSDVIALNDGDNTLTYDALLTAVMRVRNWFEQAPVSVVALVGDNTLAWIVTDLALLDLPVRVVPIPEFFSDAQVQHVFEQAGVDVVVGTSVDLESCSAIYSEPFTCIDSELDIQAGWIPHAGHYHGEYEKVTFTSGSTGTPKGVRLALSTLENTAHAIAETLASVDIQSHLSLLPYATLLENCAGIYAPLLQGITLHVRKMTQLGLQSPTQFNPLLLASELHNVSPQATILVPQLLLALVTLIQRGLLNPPAFRFIAVGGGKVSRSLLQAANQSGLPVFEGYGLSECGSVVTLNTPTACQPGSTGKVLPHARLFVDMDGEIHVQGAVMKGYLGEPEVADGVIATGDIGSIDSNGFVQVSGRKKNIFITAFGRNVNPEWVEAELLTRLPVQQVAVFGEAMPSNVAIVVARNGFDRKAVESAIADCNTTLPDYARIGRLVLADQQFTDGNGLATPNGRIRRFAIANHYSEQLCVEVKDGFFSNVAVAD